MVKYDRLRKKYKNGVAISEVVDGRCMACQISLRPQYYQEVRYGKRCAPRAKCACGFSIAIRRRCSIMTFAAPLRG